MTSNSSDVDSSEFEDNSDEFSPDSEDNDGDNDQVEPLAIFSYQSLSMSKHHLLLDAGKQK